MDAVRHLARNHQRMSRPIGHHRGGLADHEPEPTVVTDRQVLDGQGGGDAVPELKEVERGGVRRQRLPGAGDLVGSLITWTPVMTRLTWS